ncbi:hypothetical protein EXU57_15940 [Segetibacter sp. 3557_3]|uniref:hypothetical protein n=1 Tax=Segetibacter sp. 3557_3 TaxID=2547429 RepID=UPI0010591C6A|nr:hypothetical protein [Segetibacter sp. 3557_3]TDH23982.1 hypothetical protein EXU57_15940 [Segetibacter sp. 3557_3]
MANGIDKLAAIIEAQPKNIVKQFRILLFPEHGAREYYKVVFGRVLFWMMILVTATYLFSLGRQFIFSWTYTKEQEMAANHYRKVWQVIYNQESKSGKRKMDTVWSKTW